MHNPLTNLSPLDGRYYQFCLDLKNMVSEYGLHRYRLIVEVQWFITLSRLPELKEIPLFSDECTQFLETFIEQYDLSAAQTIKNLEAKTNHDVKAVEYFIKTHLETHPLLSQYKEFIHFACTSEDINNLAYGLMLQDLRNHILLPHLNEIISVITSFIEKYHSLSMLARTHGQVASPTTLGKEFANVKARLLRQIDQFTQLSILGKWNGAVGNFNAHKIAYPEIHWDIVAQQFVEKLGLTYNPWTTQIEPHDAMAEYFHCLIRINTILIDFCRDIWGYIALDYFKQKLNPEETGSSTMPHKVNPIDFENAEGNLGMANALLTHFSEKLPISRWQRDLSDSTVLRNIGCSAAYLLIAIKSLLKGLGKLEVNETQIKQDLHAHWETLGEALQTVMRRYQITEPYEKLKAFTRGKTIDQKTLQQFIETLTLPDKVKANLKNLTPENYTGIASSLAQLLLQH